MNVALKNIAVGIYLMLLQLFVTQLTYVAITRCTLIMLLNQMVYISCPRHTLFISHPQITYVVSIWHTLYLLPCHPVASTYNSRLFDIRWIQWCTLYIYVTYVRLIVTYIACFNNLFHEFELSNMFLFKSNVFLIIKTFCSSSNHIRNLLLITHDPTGYTNEPSKA